MLPDLEDLEIAAESLPPEEIPDLVGKLEAFLLRLRARYTAIASGNCAEGDRLLRVDEAARVLGRTKGHLYRNHTKYPFTIRQGRLLRFSYRGIQDYLRRKNGVLTSSCQKR